MNSFEHPKNPPENSDDPFERDLDFPLEEENALDAVSLKAPEKRQKTQEELAAAIAQEEKMITQYKRMLTAYAKAKEALMHIKIKEFRVDISLGDEESPLLRAAQDELYKSLRDTNTLAAIPPSVIKAEVKQLFFEGGASFNQRMEEMQSYIATHEASLGALLIEEEAQLAAREEAT